MFFRHGSNRTSISGTIPSWVYALLYKISSAAHAFQQRSCPDETREGKQKRDGGVVRGGREINNHFELFIPMK